MVASRFRSKPAIEEIDEIDEIDELVEAELGDDIKPKRRPAGFYNNSVNTHTPGADLLTNTPKT